MTAIRGVGLALAVDRVPAGRLRRSAARPDEDAVTFAVQACAQALSAGGDEPTAFVLAGTTLPYDEGGSVQVLAELLSLADDVFAVELGSAERDGLAALHLGAALAELHSAPVLVCATHRGSSGAGAVAVLAGGAGGTALAEVTPRRSLTVELRDRWRLRGEADTREADRSFAASIGTDRLARDLVRLDGDDPAPTLVTGPDARAAAAVEKALHGPGDELRGVVGHLGAAHGLLRLVTGMREPCRVLAISNGLGECLDVVPTPAGVAAAARLSHEALASGRETPHPLAAITPDDFHPYASLPRSWRERGVDLRLEGIVADGRPPGRHRTEGTVVTWTRDHVYPAARVTDMAVVDVDGGGRFFGQVAAGETVEIGQRIVLVPRRLHEGGGVVQYFWKVSPCP